MLVLGASAAVGDALLRLLADDGIDVIAWSRRARPAASQSPEWQRGELFTDRLPAVDTILSAGPLDGLVAAWSRSHDCRPRIVVALSSSSARFKRDSIDAGERELAARLAASESALMELCRIRDARCVILRPTLIHGGGDAAHFGAIERVARSTGCVILPQSATGLRMPLHADDLAASMLRASGAPEARGTFDVGGGEVLAYDHMVTRVLRARGVEPRLLRVREGVFLVGLRCAHLCGRLRGLTAAMVRRMREDLVVDDEPARRAFGHAPGSFRPAQNPDSPGGEPINGAQ